MFYIPNSSFVYNKIERCIELLPENYCKDIMIDGYKECSSIFGYEMCDIIFMYPIHIFFCGILFFVSIL